MYINIGHRISLDLLIVSRTQQDLKSLPYTFHQFKNQDIPNYSPISRKGKYQMQSVTTHSRKNHLRQIITLENS